MALNASTLGALIKANVEAATGAPMPAISQSVWNAVAAAIVAHIVAAGVVTVVSVSGVTVGAGVSGPGTGTIS